MTGIYLKCDKCGKTLGGNVEKQMQTDTPDTTNEAAGGVSAVERVVRLTKGDK